MEIFSQILGLKGFRVHHVDMNDTELHLHLEYEEGTGVCPRCGQTSRQVRYTSRRVLRDLPLSGKACYLHIGKRTFDCLRCRTTFSETLDVADPKRDYTTRYEASLFHQVRHTTVWYVAQQEGLTDQVVARIFLRQAPKHLPSSPFDGVTRLGIDEIAERKGRKAYDLVLYDLDAGTPIDVLENRTQAELRAYLDALPLQTRQHIVDVCIDMWRPYATVVTDRLAHARLVVDRFHVMKAVNADLKALKNKVKKDLPEDAQACHYPLLKNTKDLTEKQQDILDRVYQASPQLKKAHQLKETFRKIFEKVQTVEQGQKALQRWLKKAKKAELFSDAVKTIENWFQPITNYFAHRTTNGPAEGINNKIKLIKRMAYGFRNFENFRLRILTAFLSQ
jgi:transposase